MLLSIAVAWPLDKGRKLHWNLVWMWRHKTPAHQKSTIRFITYMIGVPGISRAVSRRSTKARERIKQSGWGLLLFSGRGGLGEDPLKNAGPSGGLSLLQVLTVNIQASLAAFPGVRHKKRKIWGLKAFSSKREFHSLYKHHLHNHKNVLHYYHPDFSVSLSSPFFWPPFCFKQLSSCVNLCDRFLTHHITTVLVLHSRSVLHTYNFKNTAKSTLFSIMSSRTFHD